MNYMTLISYALQFLYWGAWGLYYAGPFIVMWKIKLLMSLYTQTEHPKILIAHVSIFNWMLACLCAVQFLNVIQVLVRLGIITYAE